MAAKNKEQVIGIVRKLLNLADTEKNDSEHQAAVALQKAHDLLEQHGLDMAEVHAQGETQWEIEDWMDDPRSQYDTWNKYLCYAAARLFNCKSYTMRRGWNKSGTYRMVSMGLIGERVDVAMVREVWPWLVKKARQAARQYAGQGWNSSHRSFAESFATRIYMRVEEMIEQDRQNEEVERTVQQSDGSAHNISTALVVAEKMNAVEEYLKDRGIEFKQAKTRARTGEYDYSAALAGDDAARNVDLNFARNLSGGDNNSEVGKLT